MTTIKAVLFDKDGTLIDFERTWLGIAEALALEATGGDGREAERLLVLGGFDANARRFLPDSVIAAGTNAEIVDLWFPTLAPDMRKERVADFDAFTAREGAARAVLLPGVGQALATLRGAGLKLGVATNDSTEGAKRTLDALGLAALFEAVYGYDAVSEPKPAPGPVLAFAEHAHLSPFEVAVVGDNRHDLVMARAASAGLSVGVLSGTGTRETLEPLADVVLGSAADLPAWLEREGRMPAHAL
ncbi:MAG TPA: HAD family hydrolase [Mesorhizobium sp.]|jgi:phosphoglycolate phosphatase|nr:HAD family hydrolase [Mesorhizobium sp.]